MLIWQLNTDTVGSLVQYGELLMMVIALHECQDFSFEPCLISMFYSQSDRAATYYFSLRPQVLDTKILIP